MDITFSNIYVISICKFHRNLVSSLRHCIGAHETVKTGKTGVTETVTRLSLGCLILVRPLM